MTYLARITYLFEIEVAYVVEMERRLAETLRTIALTFCIVADNKLISRGRTGGA